MLYLCAVIIVLIGTTNSQNVSSEARDFSGYPSSHQYDTGYDSTGSYGQTMEKWIPPTIALPSLAGCGGSVTSLFKPILTALIGAALLKLPLLFIAKALLLKLALPFGVLVAASPIFLPLLYMMFTKNSQPTTVTMSTPKPEQGDGRELINFLESSSCLEHIACTIGNSQARSDTVKPVNWLLKWMESMLDKQSSTRSRVSAYRTAYMNGAFNGNRKSCLTYKCDLPELMLHQGRSQIKIF